MHIFLLPGCNKSLFIPNMWKWGSKNYQFYSKNLSHGLQPGAEAMVHVLTGRVALYPSAFPFKLLILRHLHWCLHFHAKSWGGLGCINPVMDALEGFAHLIKRVWATGTTLRSCFSTFELREAVPGAGVYRAELHPIYIYILGVPRQVEQIARVMGWEISSWDPSCVLDSPEFSSWPCSFILEQHQYKRVKGQEAGRISLPEQGNANQWREKLC